MKIRKFLQSIEELKPSTEELEKAGLPLSEQDKWTIDVLNEEFNAYSGPIDQLVYCLDTITLYPGLEQLGDFDDDSPKGFTIWGINTFYGFYYAYNYKNGEIVLLDDNKYEEPNMYCAASAEKFLDCLHVVAQYFKLQIIDPTSSEEQKEEWIERSSKAAGGDKYKEHCMILIG